MYEYQIIITILNIVFNGGNLGKTFNENILSGLNSRSVDHDDSVDTNISKIKDISYGVLRYYYTIAAILDRLVPKKPSDEVIKTILLVAIYEVKYTKKPKYAITNDLVNLSFLLTKNQQRKGFVNAVIRNYIRRKDKLELSLTNNLEVKYNFPKWWINTLVKEYPKQYSQILQNSNILPKMNLRVNPRQISLKEYTKLLSQENIKFIIIDNKISLTQTTSPHKLPLFSEGAVSIQDLHAQKLLDLINLKNDAALTQDMYAPKTEDMLFLRTHACGKSELTLLAKETISFLKDGDYVLDACAAPGGKMCQILENYEVEMLGLDIDQSRLEKVQQNLDRLKLKAKLVCGDASDNTWCDSRQFDMVIADVPCSASGTVKKNPDIKFHRHPEDINSFVITQRAIITNLWSMLKPGGTMIYITCSIFKPENEDNINYFKDNLESIKVIKSLRLLPTEYADGFFYCVLQKVLLT